MMDFIGWLYPAWLCDHLEHVTVALKIADRGEHGVLGAARLVKDVFLDIFVTHSHPS
jgi:hypothetical protein